MKVQAKYIFLFSLSIFLSCICNQLFAQKDLRQGYLFPFSYKVQIPLADLADRFGQNNSVAGGLLYKTNTNWLIGGEASFIFGSRVKDGALQKSYIFNSTGNITGADGFPADIFFFQRGFEVTAKVGKIIPMLKNNPESGLLLQLGLGILQHKIHVDQRNNAVAFLQGDYLKGIDRLTNGLAVTQYIGYMHLSRKGFLNFNIGIEAIEGFTKNRRAYNYDEIRAETEGRLDMYIGLRFGIILPVYSQKDDYFYN